MRFQHFASLDAPLPATYREPHHKEAAVTIPRLGPGQDAAMPPKDRHGKTAQNYRAALIAELDAVPDYRRHRKAQRSPLLFVWLLVPVALLWLNWPWVQRWLHPDCVGKLLCEVAETQNPTSPANPFAPTPRQVITAPRLLNACFKQGYSIDEGSSGAAMAPYPTEHGLGCGEKVSAAYLARYKMGKELTRLRSLSSLLVNQCYSTSSGAAANLIWPHREFTTIGLIGLPFTVINVNLSERFNLREPITQLIIAAPKHNHGYQIE